MQELLTEIELRIATLNQNHSNEIQIPTGEPSAAIQDYLDTCQNQRIRRQQVQDLKQLQSHIQHEIDHQEALRDQQLAESDEEARQKLIVAERKKLTKELSKLDPLSVKASQVLLKLSILGR